MHITRIELENIKSYESASFEFSRGTTAITGDNGAGKTTLIEAIAWTLFGVLDYKKEEFVRRGAKKGSVRVSFESDLDQREYTVYRDTGTGYYVHDNVLKSRIADKKKRSRGFYGSIWASNREQIWSRFSNTPSVSRRELLQQFFWQRPLTENEPSMHY